MTTIVQTLQQANATSWTKGACMQELPTLVLFDQIETKLILHMELLKGTKFQANEGFLMVDVNVVQNTFETEIRPKFSALQLMFVDFVTFIFN